MVRLNIMVGKTPRNYLYVCKLLSALVSLEYSKEYIMFVHSPVSVNRRHKREKKGSGFINTLINKLPLELHIPGYQYCGPGTKLQERLARGDPGINGLDRLCRTHDIEYSKSSDLQDRHKADYELEQRAWDRVNSEDADWKERAAAWGIVNAMKVKRKMGMGMRKKRKTTRRRKGGGLRKNMLSFNGAVRRARRGIRNKKFGSLIAMAKQALSSIGTRKLASPKTRIIPIPKTGGFLPLIPLFAALSAIGSIGAGAAGIAKAVNAAKAAKEQLAEQKRHDMSMEQATIGKGLYMRSYKKGMGLYLEPYKKNFQ